MISSEIIFDVTKAVIYDLKEILINNDFFKKHEIIIRYSFPKSWRDDDDDIMFKSTSKSIKMYPEFWNFVGQEFQRITSYIELIYFESSFKDPIDYYQSRKWLHLAYKLDMNEDQLIIDKNMSSIPLLSLSQNFSVCLADPRSFYKAADFIYMNALYEIRSSFGTLNGKGLKVRLFYD